MGANVRRILALAIGVFLIFNGILILSKDNCSSVSLDGSGNRVLGVICRPDDVGWVSDTIAGFGLIIIGLAIGFIFLGRSKREVTP